MRILPDNFPLRSRRTISTALLRYLNHRMDYTIVCPNRKWSEKH